MTNQNLRLLALLAVAGFVASSAGRSALAQDSYYPEAGLAVMLNSPAACANEVVKEFPQNCTIGSPAAGTDPGCEDQCEECCDQSAAAFPIDLSSVRDSCDCLESSQISTPGWGWMDCVDKDMLNPLFVGGWLDQGQYHILRTGFETFLNTFENLQELKGRRGAIYLNDDQERILEGGIRTLEGMLNETPLETLNDGLAAMMYLHQKSKEICLAGDSGVAQELVNGCKNFCQRVFPPQAPTPPTNPEPEPTPEPAPEPDPGPGGGDVDLKPWIDVPVVPIDFGGGRPDLGPSGSADTQGLICASVPWAFGGVVCWWD